MKKILIIFMALMFMMNVAACGSAGQESEASEAESTSVETIRQTESISEQTESNDLKRVASDEREETEVDTAMKMKVQIGDQSFTATLEDNAAVRELVDMMREAPVSVDMSDYSGFEKVGSLGRSLTTDNRQTTTGAGDIVLYNGDHIVMFYGSNSWSYTRIGHINDLTGWEEALGDGSITAVFSVEE